MSLHASLGPDLHNSVRSGDRCTELVHRSSCLRYETTFRLWHACGRLHACTFCRPFSEKLRCFEVVEEAWGSCFAPEPHKRLAHAVLPATLSINHISGACSSAAVIEWTGLFILTTENRLIAADLLKRQSSLKPRNGCHGTNAFQGCLHG